MKKLLYYFCVVLLSTSLFGCKGGGGSNGGGSNDDGADNSNFQQAGTICAGDCFCVRDRSHFSGSLQLGNDYFLVKESDGSLYCKVDDPTSNTSKVTCCQSKEAGACKCYSCNKDSVYSTDIGLQKHCSISNKSKSQCISFIGSDGGIGTSNMKAGDFERKKRIGYYKELEKDEKEHGAATKVGNANLGDGIFEVRNIPNQDTNAKNSVNQRQQVIKSNIVKYLEKSADPKNEDLKGFIAWFKDGQNNLGNELSILWLVDKKITTDPQIKTLREQTSQQQGYYDDDINLNNIEDAIYKWDENKALPLLVKEDFDEFIFAVYFFQYYPRLAEVVGPFETVGVMFGGMSLVSLDPTKTLLQQYKNVFPKKDEDIVLQIKDALHQSGFTGGGDVKEITSSQEINNTLEQIQNHDLVFIKVGAANKVTAAMFKNNGNYYYYNPSTPKGEVTVVETSKMADELLADFGGVEKVKDLRFFVWG